LGTVATIARHSVIYGLGDLVARSIAFLLIPVYTRYLSPDQYGTLELLELTSFIVGNVLALGISQSVVRFYYEYADQKSRDRVVSVALITIWTICGVAALPLFFFAPGISELVFDVDSYGHLLQITFATLLLSLCGDIPMTLLRIHERSITYVALSSLRAGLNFATSLTLVVVYGLGIRGILVGGLVSTSIFALVASVIVVRRLELHFDRKIARAMLTYSAPLVGSWLGMFVLNYADRFFLQRLASLSDVGIYALAYRFGMLPNMFVLMPFFQVWGPKRFELVSEPDAAKTYARVFTYFYFVELFLALGVAVLARDVLALMAAPSFQVAATYVPTLLVAYVIYGAYTYAQFGLLLGKRTRLLAALVVTAAAASVALNALLIPPLGTWGAVISTLGSFALLAVATHFVAQRMYPIAYEYGRLVAMTAVALALFAASSYVDVDSHAVSLAIRTAIAFCFPLLLLATGIVRREERRALVAFVRRALGR
jgi:O-antigen/teichoic acid export membrane protein